MSPSPVRKPPPLLPLDRIALFLDFDGTLIDLAPRPEDVTVPPDLPVLLARLHVALGGALAIVSGRPIASVDRLLAPLRLPAGGAHGAELRVAQDGAIQEVGEPLPDDLIDHLNGIAKELRKQWPDILLEDKRSSLAIHYRLAPEAEPALRARLDALALPAPWQILTGHCVYEIRAADRNKGSAIAQLCRHAPFAGRQPVFVGDDRTDLDGMAVALKAGGYGIAVGSLDAPVEWALPDAAAVQEWIRKLVG